MNVSPCNEIIFIFQPNNYCYKSMWSVLPTSHCEQWAFFLWETFESEGGNFFDCFQLSLFCSTFSISQVTLGFGAHEIGCNESWCWEFFNVLMSSLSPPHESMRIKRGWAVRRSRGVKAKVIFHRQPLKC